MNVNVQRVNAGQNFNQPRSDGFNINGNVTFRIIPK